MGSGWLDRGATPSPRRGNRQALAWSLILGVAILAALLLGIDLDRLWHAIVHARWEYLALAVGCSVIANVFEGFRLRWLCPELELPLLQHIRLALRASFVGQATVGILGADAFRLAALARRGAPVVKIAGRITVARVVGLAANAIALAGAGLALVAGPPVGARDMLEGAVGAAGIIAVAALLAIWLAVTGRLRHVLPSRLHRLARDVALERATITYWSLGWTWAASFGIVGLRAAALWCVAAAGGLTLGVAETMFVASIASLAMLMPGGGIGVREAGVAGYLTVFQATAAIALAVALLSRAAAIIAACAGAVIAAILGIGQHRRHGP